MPEPEPAPAEFAGEPAAPSAPAPTLRCWRCDKPLPPGALRCGACAAPVATTPVTSSASSSAIAAAHIDPLVRTMWFYGALLAISIVHGLVMHWQAATPAPGDRPVRQFQLEQTLVVEGLMTVVVLIALATVRLPPSHVVSPSLAARVLAMLASPLLLVAMLAANFGYHYLLNEILRLPLVESDLAGRNDLLPLAVLVICVQPAIIEELFFRYLVLGTLRAVISPAMAVGISAIMFGLAHIGVPLSIPLLVVLGIVLGYLRVATGGLAIPILFHFAHNAVVLYWEMTA